MVKNKLKGVVAVFVAIFLVSFAIAIVTKGNLTHSIEKTYAPTDTIKGWINISLSNEPITSLLKSSFGGNITLIDLIKKTSNSAFEYSCSPLSCEANYLATGEATSKILNLNENQTVLGGINISKKGGLLTDISSFTVHLASNNPETEKLPLTIDILRDGQKEWISYVASENFGQENYGCFIGTSGMSKANIANIPYCQRIRLSKTPETDIGAYVEEVTPGVGLVNFDMTIAKTDGSRSASCPTSASESGRVSCIPINFPINEDGDYHVCIKTSSSMDINKYKIAYEQTSPCGFTGTFEGVYDYDFEIFARPKMYAANANFYLDDDGLIGAGSPVSNIEQYLESYIADTYNNNCSNDCIIPIEIFSGVQQQLNITELSLSYVIKISDTTHNIYEVSVSPSRMSSPGFQKLYLTDAGFEVPAEYGNHTFSLSLNSEELFSENIVVVPIAGIKSLNPTKTAIKYPTKFTILLNQTQNISQYLWKFGDGNSQTTATNSVTYTYNTVGEYKMTVTIVDSKARNSSKEFSITVGPASTIVPDLLSQAETSLAYIKSQIANFSAFEQKALDYSLKLEEIGADITRLKSSISGASSEAQYEAVLGELLEMKIPISLAKTAYSEGISFYPKGEVIDMGIVKKIGGGDYETNKEDEYKEAVLAWEQANTNTVLVYSEISSIYSDYEEPFLRTFDISVTNSNQAQAYLIIKSMDNLLFKEDYSEIEEDGYFYIPLNQGGNNFVFSTTEDVDFISLPAFVSPAISQLSLAEWTPLTPEGGLKRWILFIIIVVLIILAALCIWIFLQMWYKRKYENFLFKNRNNLYNLMNYIGNEKKKGTSEKQMAEKLRKAGWNSEQTRYALRKYSGKRTGMPEIPVGKILREKKKANNSAKK